MKFLLALRYHRLHPFRKRDGLELFKEHLRDIRDRFCVVLPGDCLKKNKLSLCLTFDGAGFDFYHYVFPLLKELKLRAVLGVPVHYPLDYTTLPVEERLSVPYALTTQDGFFEKKAPFCTWEELKEMTESGYVKMASQSYKHCNLTFPFVDLHREIVESKKILESQLGQDVSTFIYPFGKTTPELNKYVLNHYAYCFQLGASMNFSWKEKEGPLSRIRVDNLTGPSSLFTLSKKLKYCLRAF